MGSGTVVVEGKADVDDSFSRLERDDVFETETEPKVRVEALHFGSSNGVPSSTPESVGALSSAKVSGRAPSVTEEQKFDSEDSELAACGCLKRTLPPAAAEELPFDVNEGKMSKLEDYFRHRYAASTFNVCKHQPLPMMRGAEPMRFLMKEDAVPVAVHRPSQIPVHWQEKVRADIDRDIRLGVLERVRQNTPVTWCSRMHVVAKKNGEPRRVIDLRPVNAA